MIDYQVLCQAIEHWKQGGAPGGVAPEAMEEMDSGLVEMDPVDAVGEAASTGALDEDAAAHADADEAVERSDDTDAFGDSDDREDDSVDSGDSADDSMDSGERPD